MRLKCVINSDKLELYSAFHLFKETSKTNRNASKF